MLRIVKRCHRQIVVFHHNLVIANRQSEFQLVPHAIRDVHLQRRFDNKYVFQTCCSGRSRSTDSICCTPFCSWDTSCQKRPISLAYFWAFPRESRNFVTCCGCKRKIWLCRYGGATSPIRVVKLGSKCRSCPCIKGGATQVSRYGKLDSNQRLGRAW